MKDICSKVEKCPIFINNVLTIENAAVAYKTLYCEAGEERYKKCKRFIVSNAVGSCPPGVMPNSCKSVEEIMGKIAVK